MAEGGDQLFVRQALQRRMSWHAILPLPHAEFARDFTLEQWREVQALLDKAEHLQIANDGGPRDRRLPRLRHGDRQRIGPAAGGVGRRGGARPRRHGRGHRVRALGGQAHRHHRRDHRRATDRELGGAQRARAGAGEPQSPPRCADLGREPLPGARRGVRVPAEMRFRSDAKARRASVA